MRFDIMILTHRRDRRLERSDHTINILIPHWRRMGLSVAMQRGLPRDDVEAVVAVNHVDLTVTPPDYVAWLERFPMAINRQLTDISKTRLHLDLASPGEGYEGAVIVKTNLNNGGAKERRLADPWRWGWRRAARHLVPVARRDLRAWSDLAWLGALDYPIYDRVSLVPEAVWTNPHLVVQKFQPERNGDGRYRLRSWYVLGDRGFHVLTSASEPIVRGSNILAREVVDIETPPELVSLRTEMAVDFGRFDYVLAGGRAVIFDVNRTPASSPGAIKCYAREWREMAAGIDAFWK